MKQMSYKKDDVQKWWSGVRWVQDQRPDLQGAESMNGQTTTTQTVSKAVLQQTLSNLEQAGVLQRPEGGWNHGDFAPAHKIVA